MENLISPFTDIIKDLVKHILVFAKRHICYAFTCNSNVDKLNNDANDLESRRVRLQHSVDEATGNGEEIYLDVTNWLATAENAIRDARQLIDGRDEAMLCIDHA